MSIILLLEAVQINGFDIHGLFGNILDTNEVEMLELDLIKKHIQNVSNKNIDIFKTVISLKEEDAIKYGFLNKKAWNNLIQEKTLEISKAFKIPINDMEVEYNTGIKFVAIILILL